MDGRDTWYDEDAGPLVRPYAVTGGRTRTDRQELQLITLVVAVGRLRRPDGHGLDLEYRQILQFCETPVSIAEISSVLELPLSVVKILVGDLVGWGLLIFREPATPDLDVLKAVVHGIRQI
jgi:hypothetical protein